MQHISKFAPKASNLKFQYESPNLEIDISKVKLLFSCGIGHFAVLLISTTDLILVYTHKITPRIRYIFKHIFSRILLVPVDFTSKIEEFVAHNGPKMSYTKVALGNEFFVRSQGLLFEQGVSDLEVNLGKWGDVPSFFTAGSKSSIPYDIFAASFFLISRYEEYLPHVRDKHERLIRSKVLPLKISF